MLRHILVALVSLALSSDQVWMYGIYQTYIPNGGNVTCNSVHVMGVGHVNPSGGGQLNQFGLHFRDYGLVWNFALCMEDSDGDSKTNGEELGDPNCVWTMGSNTISASTVSHPGDMNC